MGGRILLLALAGIGSAIAGLVQDDGTVRNSAGTLCASNANGLIRMRTCDTSDTRQIFEYDDATRMVRSPSNNVCWWVPSTADQNKAWTNQRVWLIRCDTNSPRTEASQMQFYMDGGAIKNVYTDSKIADYCLMNNEINRPLKMKPCSHGRTFSALN